MSIKRFKYVKNLVEFSEGNAKPYPQKGQVLKVIAGSKSPYWVTCRSADGELYCLFHKYLEGIPSTKLLDIQYNLTCL